MDTPQPENPVHVFINETKTKFLHVKSFPCADCGYLVRPKLRDNQIHSNPVFHGLQIGKCLNCRALHFVINGRTKEDCIALEPVLNKFLETLSARKFPVFGSSFD